MMGKNPHPRAQTDAGDMQAAKPPHPRRVLYRRTAIAAVVCAAVLCAAAAWWFLPHRQKAAASFATAAASGSDTVWGTAPASTGETASSATAVQGSLACGPMISILVYHGQIYTSTFLLPNAADAATGKRLQGALLQRAGVSSAAVSSSAAASGAVTHRTEPFITAVSAPGDLYTASGYDPDDVLLCVNTSGAAPTRRLYVNLRRMQTGAQIAQALRLDDARVVSLAPSFTPALAEKPVDNAVKTVFLQALAGMESAPDSTAAAGASRPFRLTLADGLELGLTLYADGTLYCATLGQKILLLTGGAMKTLWDALGEADTASAAVVSASLSSDYFAALG